MCVLSELNRACDHAGCVCVKECLRSCRLCVCVCVKQSLRSWQVVCVKECAIIQAAYFSLSSVARSRF